MFDPCYVYEPGFIDARARAEILAWLATLHPLWERRYSTRRPLPPGREQRQLLRPVYWLGTWQFACLGYYEPPRRIRGTAIAAEPFPRVLGRLVAQIERRVRGGFPPATVPRRWHLNTCLVNFYGERRDGDKWIDAARVGEHRDFEPGPVASLSIGERARFQFVRRGARDAPPVRTQWLDDGSLQIFGGPRWKDDLLHRVQRVDDKHDLSLPPVIDGFRTRRVNLTFRYVPDEHVARFADLPPAARDDVRDYVATLAASSPFFAAELDRAGGPRGSGSGYVPRMALPDRLLPLCDLLLGAAYADRQFKDRERQEVRTRLSQVAGGALPAEVEQRLSSFDPAAFELAATAAAFRGDPEADRRQVLILVAAINDADDEVDFAEDDYLRALAAALDLPASALAGLTIEIVRQQPPPPPKKK